MHSHHTHHQADHVVGCYLFQQLLDLSLMSLAPGLVGVCLQGIKVGLTGS